MNVSKRLLAILFGLLTTLPASADDMYLIYPKAWCDLEEPISLPFSTPGLGPFRIQGSIQSTTGQVLPSSPWHPSSTSVTRSYRPNCAEFTEAGFDFFQLIDGSGNQLNVTVLLGDGDPSVENLVENAQGGALDDWRAFPEIGSSGVEIVEWQNDDMEGTHGFRVSSSNQDRFLSYRFEEQELSQPRLPEGNGTNGVTTEIILKPPPSGGEWGDESEAQTLLYVAGRFDNGEIDTVLRLRRVGDTYSIRAEAAATTGTVMTDWCLLETGQANEVKLEHLQTLSLDDWITLEVTGPSSCSVSQQGFVSVRTASPEYRVGAMDSDDGALIFDFDHIRVETIRYKPRLRLEVRDDFEDGSGWNSIWQPVDPSSLTVTPSAAHTGQYGLLVEPMDAQPAFLLHQLPSAASELACRFSLDADFTSHSPDPWILVLKARSSSQNHVRVWLRHSSEGYQLRARSGSEIGSWHPLGELPVSLFFNWNQGVLDIRFSGCELSENGCRETLGSFTTDGIDRISMGAINANHAVDHGLTIDDVQCLAATNTTNTQ